MPSYDCEYTRSIIDQHFSKRNKDTLRKLKNAIRAHIFIMGDGKTIIACKKCHKYYLAKKQETE